MRKTFTLLTAVGSLLAGTAFAQAPKRTCGTLTAIAELQKQDPGYAQRMQQNEAAIAQFLNNPANRQAAQATKTIPVVVHVVYGNSSQNVPDAQIHAQIARLNTDFRRMNADTMSAPTIFRNLGADTQIEFCLASVDPTGQPTTGITRTSTTVSAFPVNNAVKANATGGKDPWPRNNYLNIWICNITQGILGFATPPGGPAASDGVVLLYNSLPGGSGAPYNQGRTATHEVGHWLNLQHIWGDEPACGADDQVADTPQQKEENYGCPTFPLTTGPGAACPGSNTNGAMFMNYMDYTDDACMNMFSKGQRDRMVAALTTLRPTLLASTACSNTLMANFTASSTTVSAGSTVTFSDLSTGAPTNWSWTFAGGTPATSTSQNPAVVYNNPGTYDVTLTATKGTVTNTRTIPNFITVGNVSTCIDTLGLPFTGTPTLYVSQNSGGIRNGYVSGNNGFGDKAKAELFNSGGTTITGGLFGFGRASAASPTSAVTIGVWNNGGTAGSPGTLVASKTVTISSIAADIAANRLTSVTFNSPVTVTGNFYMGVVLSTTPGDTVAIITNTDGNAPAGKAWEQMSNNAWATYTAGWGLDVSHAVFPIISGTGSGVAPVISFTPATSTICAGSTVTYNSSATTGATSFSWNFPGGTPATSTAANPTVTYSTAGTYNVSLTASNANGCNSTATLNRPNAITVTTGPTVAVSPAFASNCNPTPVTLTATGATSYTWSPAAGLSATTGASVVANPTATTTYTVTGTTNGCTSTAQVTIIVGQVTASFTATPNVVDLKTSGVVNFTNTSSSNALFYNWDFGVPAAGALNTSTLRNPPAFTYTTPGTYTVTLTSSTSTCSDTETFSLVVRNTTGLEEAYDNGTIRIFPNPAKNFLQVEVPERENVTEVQLTNAVGQVIARQKPAAGQARLNVSTLANGIYFVKISNAEGSITRKISVMQ